MTYTKGKKANHRNLWMTGLVFGSGFGIAGSILLYLWLSKLLLFFPTVFFVILFAPLALGPAVCIRLARMNAIPRIHPVPMVAFALGTACAPYLAGLVEIQLRDDPFPFPSNVQVTVVRASPSGDRVLFLESSYDVPVFLEQLVVAAKSAGWQCEYWEFDSSTETGVAGFKTTSTISKEKLGYLGIKVLRGGTWGTWSDAPSSELTQARVFHALPTRGPVYAFLATVLLFLAVVLFRLSRKRLG